jgi:REP element-mobilizing transposase RayT
MTLPRRVLPNTTYLITRRCVGRRFLLRPDSALNALFKYYLALGAERYGIEMHSVCVMSNHYHVILTDVRGVLPDFMCWLNSQLAKRVKSLRRWDEVLWEPNVHFSSVALEGSAEVLDKTAYAILNPVSAGLVRRPEDWPGLTSTLETLRSGEVRVTRPSGTLTDGYPAELQLKFTPPPCFGEAASYLDALERLVESRLNALHSEWAREGRRALGRKAVLQTPTTARSRGPKARFGCSPTFSALTRGTWHRAVRRLREFRAAYRRAYEAWRSGEPGIEFPAGTWWVVRCANASVATHSSTATGASA